MPSTLSGETQEPLAFSAVDAQLLPGAFPVQRPLDLVGSRLPSRASVSQQALRARRVYMLPVSRSDVKCARSCSRGSG